MENFNIKPGMSLWQDMPDHYKEAYYSHHPKWMNNPVGETMGKYEILITGSSRPQLWPFFWESVKKMCIMREPHRVTVHEDFVFNNPSTKVVEYVNELQNRGEIDVLDTDRPAIGLAETLNRYLAKRLEAKYVFYLQEDWEFERPVDIDRIVYVMDRNPHINLIFFNKIKNVGSINHQQQRPETYDGLDLCLYHSWAFLPGIWRREFVVNNWPYPTHHPEGAFTQVFGNHDQRTPCEYCKNTFGAYIYGPQGDPRYVRHLGNDWRMAKWRLEDGKPGGCHDETRMDLPYMAPWVPYTQRPVQHPDKKE